MNVRIKQLAEQNGFIHNWQPPGEQRDILKNLEKFATLIVKECLHIVDDEGAGEGSCIRAMIRIQDEFGVE